MTLLTELVDEVRGVFETPWAREVAQVVPSPDDIRLRSNHAKHLAAATVLYADLRDSTTMVESRGWEVAAEVYKAYLRCAARVISSEGGIITAYDGDRVMAIFTGLGRNTLAARAAFKINTAVNFVIQPLFNAQHGTNAFQVRHTIGIDTSDLRAIRIGVRGENDITWVGSAANRAAKLCNREGPALWITHSVKFDLAPTATNRLDGGLAWTPALWREMGDDLIYSSDCYWSEIP